MALPKTPVRLRAGIFAPAGMVTKARTTGRAQKPRQGQLGAIVNLVSVGLLSPFLPWTWPSSAAMLKFLVIVLGRTTRFQ